MFFFPIFPKARAAHKAAKKLYARIMPQSRESVFYASLNVPDTFSGRFEMIALHAGLVINRVRKEGKDGQLLAQSIFDQMFLDMDMACRQAGIGDLGVPKHIKKMMKAVQGRALTYDEAAQAGNLPEALAKNLYATVERPPESILNIMSQYVLACRETLEVQTMSDFQNGQLSFAKLPEGDVNVEISKVA